MKKRFDLVYCWIVSIVPDRQAGSEPRFSASPETSCSPDVKPIGTSREEVTLVSQSMILRACHTFNRWYNGSSEAFVRALKFIEFLHRKLQVRDPTSIVCDVLPHKIYRRYFPEVAHRITRPKRNSCHYTDDWTWRAHLFRSSRPSTFITRDFVNPPPTSGFVLGPTQLSGTEAAKRSLRGEVAS